MRLWTGFASVQIRARHRAITWTNVDLLSVGPIGTNFVEIWIEIMIFLFKNMWLKISSAKWRPFGFTDVSFLLIILMCRFFCQDHRKSHNDAIKWKHFPRHWPFVRGIQRPPVDSPHKGQWRGALVFSLIYVVTDCWANNQEVGDLRRYHAHNDVTVITIVSLSIIHQVHAYRCLYETKFVLRWGDMQSVE